MNSSDMDQVIIARLCKKNLELKKANSRQLEINKSLMVLLHTEQNHNKKTQNGNHKSYESFLCELDPSMNAEEPNAVVDLDPSMNEDAQKVQDPVPRKVRPKVKHTSSTAQNVSVAKPTNRGQKPTCRVERKTSTPSKSYEDGQPETGRSDLNRNGRPRRKAAPTSLVEPDLRHKMRRD